MTTYEFIIKQRKKNELKRTKIVPKVKISSKFNKAYKLKKSFSNSLNIDGKIKYKIDFHEESKNSLENKEKPPNKNEETSSPTDKSFEDFGQNSFHSSFPPQNILFKPDFLNPLTILRENTDSKSDSVSSSNKNLPSLSNEFLKEKPEIIISNENPNLSTITLPNLSSLQEHFPSQERIITN